MPVKVTLKKGGKTIKYTIGKSGGGGGGGG